VFVLATFLSTVLAFIVRAEPLQVTLSLLSTFCLVVLSLKSKRLCRDFFIYAFLTHLTAFYWLPKTLQVFGGFELWLAILVHILFAATAAVQWLIIGYLFRISKSQGKVNGIIIFPALYAISDLTFPQLFPWSFSNPLISFSPLAVFAEIFGSKGVSFITFLLVELIVAAHFSKTKKSLGIAISATAITLLIGVGLDLRNTYALAEAKTVRLGLIQGNISLDEKLEDQTEANLKVHQILSSEAKSKGAELLIWPETSVLKWTPTFIKNLRHTEFDPTGGLEINLLYGLLSYQGRTSAELKRYNGAFLIDSTGELKGHYEKQVLMPFGEFLPFEKTFPWLREVSPMTGDFQRGESSKPLFLSIGDKVLKPTILICYEDLVPDLVRKGSLEGGNFLVNLTNDAWYGDTDAQWQHMLLAQWRTIESNRSLIRATNTGVSAIISPRGELSVHLPTFQKGVIVQDAQLSDRITLYSRYGDILLVILIVLTLSFTVARRVRS